MEKTGTHRKSNEETKDKKETARLEEKEKDIKLEEDGPAKDHPDSNVNSKPHSLYDVLGVKNDATTAEIKKAYRLLVIRTHPDKCKDPDASEKFQKLTKVYEILVDEEKRKLYDDAGIIPGEHDDIDDLAGKTFEELYKYYRNIYRKIDLEDIEDYKVEYRGGKGELEDIESLYDRLDGDVTRILDYIPYSEESDIQRFVNIIEQAIKQGSLGETKKWKKAKAVLLKTAASVEQLGDITEEDRKRHRETHGEDKENRKRAKMADGGGSSKTSELAAMILARKHKREDEFDHMMGALEAKYAKPSKSKGKDKNKAK